MDETFAALIILDEHHRVQRVFQVLAHHFLLNLRAALQHEVKESLSRHTVVQLVFVYFAKEIPIFLDTLETTLGAKAHVNLVSHRVIKLLVLEPVENTLFSVF